MFVPSLSWQNESSFYSNQKRTDAYPFLRFLRFLLVLASSPIHEASSTSTPSSSTFPPGPNVTGRPCTKITIRGFFKATSAASSCICTPGRSREMRSVPSPQVPAPASALKSALRMGRPPSLNLRGMTYALCWPGQVLPESPSSAMERSEALAATTCEKYRSSSASSV